MTLKVPQKLSDKWEKILAEEGLAPLGRRDNESDKSIAVATGNYKQLPLSLAFELEATRKESLFEYYYRAEHFLNAYKGFSKRERAIYELNTQGLSVRDISEALYRFKNTSRMAVYRTLKKLDKIMLSADWDLPGKV